MNGQQQAPRPAAGDDKRAREQRNDEKRTEVAVLAGDWLENPKYYDSGAIA